LIRRTALGLAVVLANGPVRAHAQEARGSDTCVDVRVGTERAYDCLNQALARSVPQRPTPAVPPVTASSSAPATGLFNESATRERLGTNFGHSAQPQRPPPGVYGFPIMHRAE
jgi:hypothetical protein